MSFATRLKQVMEEREVKPVELAAMIGKGKSSVSQYLSGKNVPKHDVQEKIAEVLDCTVEYLNEETALNDHTKNGLYSVPIPLAAKILGKSDQFVRTALQVGTAPFGFAAMKRTKWSYHISPSKLKEYVGSETYYQFVSK